MRETTIYWPEASLGCPLADGYTGRGDPTFVTSEVVDGPPRYRLATYDERRTFNLAFRWRWEQVQVFEAFVASDLNMGLEWFRMNQLTGAGMTEHFCHILGDYSIRATSETTSLFDVDMQVEAYLNAHGVPPAFVWGDDIDARNVADPAPVDGYDARWADEPRPPDGIDALVPGA